VEPLWGFWWLPFVVEALGGFEGSRRWWWVAGKWPESYWNSHQKMPAVGNEAA